MFGFLYKTIPSPPSPTVFFLLHFILMTFSHDFFSFWFFPVTFFLVTFIPMPFFLVTLFPCDLFSLWLFSCVFFSLWFLCPWLIFLWCYFFVTFFCDFFLLLSFMISVLQWFFHTYFFPITFYPSTEVNPEYLLPFSCQDKMLSFYTRLVENRSAILGPILIKFELARHLMVLHTISSFEISRTKM